MNRKILNKFVVFLSVFLLLSCEKDFYEDSFYQQQAQEDIKVNKISFEKFNKKFQKLKNKPKIDNLMKPTKEFQAQARTTTSSGVVIYTDDIKEITQGDYTSYTMLMELPNQTDDKFFNVTIEEKNNEVGVFVTKYTPTESWKANPNQTFNGQSVIFRVPEELNSIDNVLSQIGNDDGGGVLSNGLGSTPIYTTSPLTEYPPYDCQGWIYNVEVMKPYNCACGHTPDEYCAGCPTGFPKYPGYEPITMYYCVTLNNHIPNDNPPTGGNNGGSGSGPSSGSSSAGTAGSNNTGTPVSITTVVNPLPKPEDNPCIKLKDLLDKANIGQTVNYLAQTLTEDNKKEFGAIFTRTEDKNYTTYGTAPGAIDGQININTNYPNMIAAIHSHPMDTYPLFSFGDILVLNSMNNYMEAHNEGLATFLVVSKNDVNDANPNLYAIVLNTTGAINIFDQINSQVFEGCTLLQAENEQIRRLEKLFFTDPNPERAFLRYIQNTNISLYKANSSLSNWSELKLSNLSTNSNISSTDCD